MSAQAPIEDSPAGPGGTPGALRLLGLVAVCLGVAALAAATFVLSYAGIHAMALQAGIQPRYARGYPLLIDAMLVMVLGAVLALRGAGWPSRILAWLLLLIVLAAAAGADALHATGRKLPHNTVAITAAVLPWALVFAAFVLLLTMLRHARVRHQAGRADRQPSPVPGQSAARPAPPLPTRTPRSGDAASIVPGLTSQLVSSAAAGAAAGAAAADVEWPGTGRFAAVPAPGAAQAAQPADYTAGRPHEGAETAAAAPAAAAPDAGTVTAAGEPGRPAGAGPAENGPAGDGSTGADSAQTDSAQTGADRDKADPAQADSAETGPAQADGAQGSALSADTPTANADPGETDPGETDPGGTGETAGDPAENDMPVFHRMWSAPTPPAPPAN